MNRSQGVRVCWAVRLVPCLLGREDIGDAPEELRLPCVCKRARWAPPKAVGQAAPSPRPQGSLSIPGCPQHLHGWCCALASTVGSLVLCPWDGWGERGQCQTGPRATPPPPPFPRGSRCRDTSSQGCLHLSDELLLPLANIASKRKYRGGGWEGGGGVGGVLRRLICMRGGAAGLSPGSRWHRGGSGREAGAPKFPRDWVHVAGEMLGAG